MMKQIEAEGKTVEEAIENGLVQLNVEREDVEIEILETEHKGMFGRLIRPARVKLSLAQGDLGAKAEQFLQSIFEKMNLTVTCDIRVTEKNIKIELSGDEMGVVIGRRGETLDALQYLTTLAVNRGEEEYHKVSIDTENYRQEREQTLIALANRLAQKALRVKRNVSLEPMNAYERKIIHSALQENEEVTTYSIGEEPNRKIIISPRGYESRKKQPRIHH